MFLPKMKTFLSHVPEIVFRDLRAVPNRYLVVREMRGGTFASSMSCNGDSRYRLARISIDELDRDELRWMDAHWT